MSNLSFLEKLKILGNMTSSSVLFIFAIILFIILGFLFATTNKKNYKSSRTLYILMYLSIIIFVAVTYSSSLNKMLDYMFNNLFIVIYFPNLAIYLAAIIITNIIMLISVFNFKKSKAIKVINISVSGIMHYLLILLLNIITDNELDVFTQTSVYSNKEALALIELSSTVFVVWILFLILYKIIITYLKREDEEVPVEIKNTKNNTLSNIKKINYPMIVKKEVTKKREPQVNKEPVIVKSEPVIVESKPISFTSDLENINSYDKMLTLDDYKLLVSMLKQEKLKKQQEGEKRKLEEQQESKFMELKALYSK